MRGDFSALVNVSGPKYFDVDGNRTFTYTLLSDRT